MNLRERFLLIVVGGMVGLGLIYLMADRLIVSSVNRLNSSIESISKKNNELSLENNKLKLNIDAFNRYRQSTIDSQANGAAATLKDFIDRAAAGADIAKYNVRLVSGGVQPAVYHEAGWNISATAPLENVVDFLYLLYQNKHLRRLSNFNLQAQQEGRVVSFNGNYCTLVLDGPPQVVLPTGAVKFVPQPAPVQLLEVADLDQPQRDVYDPIIRRNLFRPFVPAGPVVATPVGPRPPVNPNPSPPKSNNPFDQMIVTDLSVVDSQPGIKISMPGQLLAKLHRPGDALPLGKIVMVDIRDLPMRDDPKRLSASRVIIRNDKNDFLAVEVGKPLSQAWVMKLSDLPEGLRSSLPQSQPASQPAGS